MSFQQLKNPNLGITYTGGWCLKAVQDAFATDHPYPTATAQWNAEPVKHTDLPPSGLYIPVFFSLAGEPAGHVAIMLPDGRVASTTQAGVHKGFYIHPNLNDLLRVYKNAGWNIKYLGWGELVGTQAVVKDNNVAIIQDAPNWMGRCNDTHWRIRGRELSRESFLNYVGKDFLNFVEDCSDDPEAQAVQNWQIVGKTAVTDDWQGQIVKLTSDLSAANSTIGNLQGQLVIANAQIEELKKQLLTAGSDTIHLNALGELLQWFVVRVGLKK